MLDGYQSQKARLIALVTTLSILGCAAQSEKIESKLRLGADLDFPVSNCVIWGHVVKVDGEWACGWSLEAAAAGREFKSRDLQEGYMVQPVLAAYAMPIEISSWRSLDGIRISSSDDEETLQQSNKSANYSLRTTTSNERCFQNRLSIRHVKAANFHVHWSGEAKLHGVEGHAFELDSSATFTGITVSGDFQSEAELNRGEVERLIKSLFPTDDFERLSMQVQQFKNEGTESFSVVAKFAPVY